jgi:hypothetical protein
VGPTMPGLRAVVESGPTPGRAMLIAFRAELHRCLRRRADALFELVDAVLTCQGPVDSLVELSEEKSFRRGHGALYDALAWGDVDDGALAELLARSWRVVDDGPVKIAMDISPWPRPDAVTSPGLCHCYAPCRCDGSRKTIPGWPFSFAAGLEWGATSWTALLDAVRIGPDQDATQVTVAQMARVVARLAAAGSLAGRPAPVFVFDSGYDLTRISYLAAQQGLAVQVLGRVRADRVYYTLPKVRRRGGRPGRPARHGERFELGNPASWPEPDEHLTAKNPRYGVVQVGAWHGLHQKLGRQGAGPHTKGNYPWCRAPSSESPSSTCPATASPRMCGCGTPLPPGPHSTSTCCGSATCAASISSTPSGRSRAPWAGRPRRSAPPSRVSAGPGWPWPPMLNFAWPGTSPPTCTGRGRNRPQLASR